MKFPELFSRATPGTAGLPACVPACVPAAGSGIVELLRRQAPEALQELLTPPGPVWVPTGPEGSALRLDIATDFGPPDEEKLCNQDAAAYRPVQAPLPGLVVALADGVSSSPYSEYGARLAVQTAVDLLDERLRQANPGDVPDPSSCQKLFDDLTDEIRRKQFMLWHAVSLGVGRFLPAGWRPQLFLEAVQEQNLFVSTMLVAVVLRGPDDHCWGFFAHVGDGGLSFRRGLEGDTPVVDALVCDPQPVLTSFLGPDVERKCFPRCFYADLGREFQLALATDGIARAVPLADLFVRWEQLAANGQANAAQTLIESLKQTIPDQVFDNLSLAFVTRRLCPAAARPTGTLAATESGERSDPNGKSDPHGPPLHAGGSQDAVETTTE